MIHLGYFCPGGGAEHSGGERVQAGLRRTDPGNTDAHAFLRDSQKLLKSKLYCSVRIGSRKHLEMGEVRIV